MEIVRLTPATSEECAARAADVLGKGGVILYPTDTIYGLGADAFSDEAVASIYTIKDRDERKPIHCVVDTIEMMERYAEVGDETRLLAKTFLPGPLTLVLPKHAIVDGGIASGMKTIGFRIPDNYFCEALSHLFASPYTTTSANLAGMQTESSVENILAQLGGAASGIDLIIDAGEVPLRLPSTVVDLSGGDPVILREGAIPASDIWNTLREEP